jgi:SAM-dependent methyltransferase
VIVKDPASPEDMIPESSISDTLYKKDFWGNENLKYSRPHYRLEKSARIINRLARDKECTLLDVGCGPAALMRLLRPNIQYYGIDIAIQDPAPNLIETDFLETPISFGDKRFDIIIAQGVFEYVGNFQAEKFAEIATLLNDNGLFIVSYVNFAHRDKNIYWPYSNVRAIDDFRQSLAHYFKIQRFFPTSHNWHHLEPSRRLVKTPNMYINVNIPFISSALAVEYFFICSRRHALPGRTRNAESGARADSRLAAAPRYQPGGATPPCYSTKIESG